MSWSFISGTNEDIGIIGEALSCFDGWWNLASTWSWKIVHRLISHVSDFPSMMSCSCFFKVCKSCQLEILLAELQTHPLKGCKCSRTTCCWNKWSNCQKKLKKPRNFHTSHPVTDMLEWRSKSSFPLVDSSKTPCSDQKRSQILSAKQQETILIHRETVHFLYFDQNAMQGLQQSLE